MKILVACERSGRVRDAFAALGHEAWSCDLLPSATPGPHVEIDILEFLKRTEGWWDMMIAFPPCTHLAVSGAKWFAQKRKDGRQGKAIEFFLNLANASIPRIAIENPVGIMSRRFRKPDQIVQPWQFGDPFQKTTCFWLKQLPKLTPTKIVSKGEFVVTAGGRRLPKWYSNGKGKRDLTFPGLAAAMASQWGRIQADVDEPEW